MQRAARVWQLLVPVVGLLACGGRYATSGHDEPDGVAGSASTSAGHGGVGTAGTSSGGAAPICPCDPIDCGPGYTQVPNANGCCFHCELDPVACRRENEAYFIYRQELLAMYSSFGCMQASDCVTFYIQNSCDHSCTLNVTGARRAVIDGLNNYAMGSCNEACFQDPKPDCGDPLPPVCVNGSCQVIR